MFNFEQYTKSTTRRCSPSVSNLHYENSLIEVLSLPLKPLSKNLALPYCNQGFLKNPLTSGEGCIKACSDDDSKYVLSCNPLNELSLKLNITNSSKNSEETHHESVLNVFDSLNLIDEEFEALNF